MKRRTIVVFALSLALAMAVASPLAAGHYIEQKVSSSQKGMNMQVRAWTDGENGKVEFHRSDSELLAEGSYLVTSDGGATVYLVRPPEKTYSVWDLEALFGTLGELINSSGGDIELDFRDVEAEELGSEPGGELLGFDTTKKSWRTAYSMYMKVVFMKQQQHMETTTHAWITDELDNPTLGMWFAVKPPTTGDPDLDYLLTESMERIQGTPLKIVQHSTRSKKKGKKGKSSSVTMEITAYREESVAQSSFVVPEGYEEVPLISFEDPGGASAGEGGGGGPLKGLGGLFGRKKD